MFFRYIAAISLALCGIACVPLTPSEPSGLRLVDLTPAVWQAWDQTAGLSPAERVASFKAHMDTRLPGFYSAERLKASPQRYDEYVYKALETPRESRAAIEEVGRQFGPMFLDATRSFEATFGPMRGYPPVYLLHSLGEFDGATRELSGRTPLLFGADMIARIHQGQDMQPFFHHELFHLLHGRTFPECEQIWCALWAEGLAVYVAERLNPGATDAQLLLDLPEPLRPAVEAARQEAVCAVAQRLDSVKPEDYRAMFNSQRLSPNLPPRFGYYVGYMVAAQAARRYTLDALAGMSTTDVKPLVLQELQRMADCS